MKKEYLKSSKREKMVRVVKRERQEMIKKIEQMVKNQIPKVWQEGVGDEGVK
jgi:hypothetical protein